jgi:DNA-binding response OmpR family regulator
MGGLQPHLIDMHLTVSWPGCVWSLTDRRGGSISPWSGSGERILVVEDEFLLADEMSDWLRLRGFDPIGPVSSLPEAQMLIAEDDAIDGAVLDVNLAGKMVFPLALELRRRNVPVIFATAYAGEVEFPDELRGDIRLKKPFTEAQLIEAIKRMLSAG